MTSPTASAPDGLLETEPVATFLAGLAGVVNLALILANAFAWLDLTDAQTAALVAFISGVIAVAGSFLRARVWSPASVHALTAPGGTL